MGFHLKSKNIILPVEPWGDENVIGIRSFNVIQNHALELAGTAVIISK